MLDFLFNDIPINQPQLAQVQATEGSVRTWGFTLDPVFHVAKEGPADFYVTGGGGIYHRNVDFTQPMALNGMPADPWFGNYAGTATSFGQYKGGIDGGVGFAVKLGASRLKLFAEARYHHIYTRPVATDMIPVTFGFRW